MAVDYRAKFIKKAKTFRKAHGLSEGGIDFLLSKKGLRYTGLESNPKKVLSLGLAEEFPKIFGLDYCTFKDVATKPPKYEELPKSTRDYIDLGPVRKAGKVGSKGSKSMASYVIRQIKDLPVGHQFLNFEILSKLPSPLNQETTIDWSNGLLKGLTKSNNKFKEYKDEAGDAKRGMVYTMEKAVTPELLKKALKNIGEERLENGKNTDDEPAD